MKAVFIDRDGVINRNRKDHVKDWVEFSFLPGAAESITELNRFGLKTVILTNQAVINRGIVDAETIERIHTRMIQELGRRGARVDGVYCCPHRPDEHCSCRKPRPGLLLAAAEDLGIELAESYLVGDALSDILAGKAAGCRTILVLTGRGLKQFLSRGARAITGYDVSRDLRRAVRRILRQEELIEAGPVERLVHGAQRVAGRPVFRHVFRGL